MRPQLTIYCDFLSRFFADNADLTREMAALLARCARLKPFYVSNDRHVLYAKSEMPLTYSGVGDFVERRDYWSRADDYSAVIGELESALWSRVRLANDPKKPKKVSAASTMGSASKTAVSDDETKNTAN